MGGGGICATIGNAHVVEYMSVWHSIIAGNSVNGSGNDLYTGSLLHFYSYGYNLVGRIDFSQILVPVPAWGDLSRKHWPKTGDHEGVAASDVFLTRRHSLTSRQADAGQRAVLGISGPRRSGLIPGGTRGRVRPGRIPTDTTVPYDFNMVLKS